MRAVTKPEGWMAVVGLGIGPGQNSPIPGPRLKPARCLSTVSSHVSPSVPPRSMFLDLETYYSILLDDFLVIFTRVKEITFIKVIINF
jgi:hypothetical protein